MKKLLTILFILFSYISFAQTNVYRVNISVYYDGEDYVVAYYPDTTVVNDKTKMCVASVIIYKNGQTYYSGLNAQYYTKRTRFRTSIQEIELVKKAIEIKKSN